MERIEATDGLEVLIASGEANVSHRHIGEPEVFFVLGMIREGVKAVIKLLEEWDEDMEALTVRQILEDDDYEEVSEALACYAWLSNWHGCVDSEEDGHQGLYIEDWAVISKVDMDYIREKLAAQFKMNSTKLVENPKQGCYSAVPHPRAYKWVKSRAELFAR